jgi:F-type H+-transporting ATPase subunit a
MEFGIPFPGLTEQDSVIFTNTLVVMVLLLLLGLLLARKVRVGRPSKPQLVMEMTINWLGGLAREIIGEGGARYLPLILTLFFFVLFANLIGMVPGFISPTSNLNTNFGLALIVFVATPFVGIREIGLKAFLKHRAGPITALAPVMFILETIGEFSRPLSLTLRLFGNIRGEEILVMMLNKIASMIYYIPITVVILPLTLVTSLVQAFIFALLPTIYFGGAAAWGEKH